MLDHYKGPGLKPGPRWEGHRFLPQLLAAGGGAAFRSRSRRWTILMAAGCLGKLQHAQAFRGVAIIQGLLGLSGKMVSPESCNLGIRHDSDANDDCRKSSSERMSLGMRQRRQHLGSTGIAGPCRQRRVAQAQLAQAIVEKPAKNTSM